mgnify:CR=1 FL=1|tara:strand:+ start:4647 stop:5006 length:360 start_codon:yes stop_codon:yes gene_type:complete
MTDKSDTIKKKLLLALEQSLGVVTTACKNVGIHRSTYYDYCNNDIEFKEEVDDIQNIAIDFAESQLHKQIQGGNTSATIFYLKTKGKNRGYIERQEITGAEGMPTNFQIEIIGSTKDKD